MSPTVCSANAVLADKEVLEAAKAAHLEKQLADEGHRDLARALHTRRMAMDEEAAYRALSGTAPGPPEMLKLAKRLAGDKRFGLARRILAKTRENLRKTDYPNIYLEIFQKSALYTYKDPDLPADWRLDRALEILGVAEDLASTRNPESLGLAGAIHKRKWEITHERQQLERALFFYLRGYAQGAPEGARGNIVQYLRDHPGATLQADEDRGYNGINASFVLDLLASQEEGERTPAAFVSDVSTRRRAAARLIREEIIRSVPPLLRAQGNEWLADEWWFYATIGEAHFGLGSIDTSHYDRSVEWLVERPAAAGLAVRGPADTTAALEVPEWEYESTARQLARLAILQGVPDTSEQAFEQTPAGQALARLLQQDSEAVRSAFRGKFGLALSGGGFRASLFHIGVLAKLAELGVLPHVEVLSCVSGGSIIGAHYYLEVQRLLQTRSDHQITPKDYVDIVERIEGAFLKG